MTGGERQQYLVALLGTLASSALQRVQTSADKPDSKVLSEQASVVYKLLHEKVAFLKKQQWTITNYIALIYAAIFAVTKELRPTSTLNYILIAAAIVACLYSLWVLSMVQRDLGKTRDVSTTRTATYSVTGNTTNWEWNQNLNPYRRGIMSFTGGLVLVLVVGATIVVFYLCSMPSAPTAQ